jgi:hypothetical protein
MWDRNTVALDCIVFCTYGLALTHFSIKIAHGGNSAIKSLQPAQLAFTTTVAIGFHSKTFLFFVINPMAFFIDYVPYCP